VDLPSEDGAEAAVIVLGIVCWVLLTACGEYLLHEASFLDGWRARQFARAQWLAKMLVCFACPWGWSALAAGCCVLLAAFVWWLHPWAVVPVLVVALPLLGLGLSRVLVVLSPMAASNQKTDKVVRRPSDAVGKSLNRLLFDRMFDVVKARMVSVVDPSVPLDQRSTPTDAGASLGLCMLSALSFRLYDGEDFILEMLSDAMVDPQTGVAGDPGRFVAAICRRFKVGQKFESEMAEEFGKVTGMTGRIPGRVVK